MWNNGSGSNEVYKYTSTGLYGFCRQLEALEENSGCVLQWDADLSETVGRQHCESFGARAFSLSVKNLQTFSVYNS